MAEFPDPLVLREVPPPSEETVVVRGGLMARASVIATAEANHADYGFYGVSVFAQEGTDPAVLWSQTEAIAPPKYKQVRCATVGELKAAGFSLLPTWDEPHFDLVLPDLNESTLSLLDRVFSPPTNEPRSR